MFDGNFSMGLKHFRNISAVFYQLVYEVGYLHTLVIVFVAGKALS